MREQTAIPAVEIGPVKIEDGVRYIVRVGMGYPLSLEHAEQIHEYFKRTLDHWWASDEKFCILVMENDATLTLDRIDGSSVCE